MSCPTPREGDSDVFDWLELQPTVEGVARSVWRKFRDYAELPDVQQSVWLAYFENRVNLDDMLGSEGTRRIAYASLRRAAVDYCLTEKAHRCGYELGDQYWYSKGELKAILPAVLTGRGSDNSAAVWDSGRVKRSGARQYMELETAIADVVVGLGKISVKDRQALMDCWGGLNDTVTNTQFHAGGRALGRLQRELGEKPPKRDYNRALS